MNADKAPSFDEMVRERKGVTLGEAKQYAAALPAEKRRTACGCYTCSAPACAACCFPTCLVNFCGGCLMYNPFMCACPDSGTPGAWTCTDMKGITKPHPNPALSCTLTTRTLIVTCALALALACTLARALTLTLTRKASPTSSCPWTRTGRWGAGAAGRSRTRKRPAATSASGAEPRSSGAQQRSSRHAGRRRVPIPPNQIPPRCTMAGGRATRRAWQSRACA